MSGCDRDAISTTTTTTTSRKVRSYRYGQRIRCHGCKEGLVKFDKSGFQCWNCDNFYCEQCFSKMDSKVWSEKAPTCEACLDRPK